MDFLKSETFINVSNAFAGECQARMRYDFFAKVAGKEGYKFIEDIFKETAHNEKAHSKVFYNFLVKYIGHGNIKVQEEYPISFAKTEDNLLYSAQGERKERGILYPNGAEVAEREGFLVIADAFIKIRDVELLHEQRFLKLREMMLSDTLYKSDTKIKWKCRNCGHIHEGFEAPDTCPNCRHEIGYYSRYFEWF